MSAETNNKKARKAIVFYDGGCPLCSKEISHYKKLTGAENVNWLDISENQQLLDTYDLTYQSAMSRFHVLDARGQWQTGAWGFVELWSHLSGYRWLAKLVRTTRTQALLDKIYSIFASRRLSSRCSESSCGS